MEMLNAGDMDRVVGGMMNGSPGTGNKNMYMDPKEHIEVSIGGFSFSGTAGAFAAGWQDLKSEAVSAGWTAAQGLSLVEAGVVCDVYSDWSVCYAAQDQVDFVLNEQDR